MIRTAVVLATVAFGCASMTSTNFIRSQGEVLREWQADGHRYYLVRAGNVVRKWDQLPSGAAGVLYEVDTVTQICKSGTVEVECAKVKRDPDMAPFVNW